MPSAYAESMKDKNKAAVREDIGGLMAELSKRPAAPERTRKLTGPERAAVLMLSLGEQYGAKIFSMLDISYVYMDIYLPTEEAGRVKIGADSRIVLDAYPDRPIPAKVSFIATQAQFTPKAVETRSEREKLMFRIRVRIDPERLRAHADAVRSGLPGVAYVRFDPNAVWPARLQGNS